MDVEHERLNGSGLIREDGASNLLRRNVRKRDRSLVLERLTFRELFSRQLGLGPYCSGTWSGLVWRMGST